ncbi:MAG TPA: hypothetical protein VGB67_13745 [Fibrella sp.]
MGKQAVVIKDEVKPWERNVLAVYRRAGSDAIAQGMEWYRKAYELAVELDPANPARAAGIIAVFSPQKLWSTNMKLARDIYSTGIASGHTPANNAKAQRIFDGAAPLDVLGGNKVRAFYQGIMNEPAARVCIDRHAFDIAVGRVTDDKTREVLGRKGVYDAFTKVYVRAAKRLGITATELQAATWVQWRIEKGLVG